MALFTAGSNVATGDLISAATWNSYLGATGSLEYLRDATHFIIGEEPAKSGTGNRTMTLANGYESGKIIVFFNGSRVLPSYLTETDSANGIFTFAATFTTYIGRDLVAGDEIVVDYILVN